MSTPIGVNGGIAVVAESTYGTDPGTGYVIQHGISSSMKMVRKYATHKRTSVGAPTVVSALPTYVAGDIAVHLTYEEDVIGVILKNAGTYATNTYTIGGTGTKTTASLCVHTNHGGLDYGDTGCIVNKLRFEFPADDGARLVVGLIGQARAKDASPPTYTLPTESQILMPTSYGALTIGGTAVLFKNLTIDVDLPHSADNRAVAGGSLIKQPIPTGPVSISGSVDVELNDATGENTIAVLDTFLSSGTLGVIALDSKITLAACRMTGDMPAWRGGLQEFPINFQCFGTLSVVTS